MPEYGPESEKQLATCHQILQQVFRRVIADFDCSITQGHRGEAEQNAVLAAGMSTLPWPKGNHNAVPSMALDAHPYPWRVGEDVDAQGALLPQGRERFLLFAGYVLGAARGMGIRMRWGGDWNRNWSTFDEKFKDWFHFELLLPL